jgi:hypothetical protein
MTITNENFSATAPCNPLSSQDGPRMRVEKAQGLDKDSYWTKALLAARD